LQTFYAWKVTESKAVKIILSVLLVSITTSVGFSRLYLNVHWFTDVLGGYFLGALWVVVSVYVFNLRTLKKTETGAPARGARGENISNFE
jgi:undecaprenyl-diphosphatase